MARSPSTNLNNALDDTVSQPGYLVRLDVAGQTFRLCTLDVGFTYGGSDWISSDVDITNMRWDQGGAQPGGMTLGDPDLIWWSFALNLALQDAPVAIWQVYAAAAGEAEPLWSGRIGRVRKDDMSVQCDLVTDVTRLRSPRRRVQEVVPAKYLIAPGRVIMIGSTQWTLERKQNG